jgi:hypothetical protein
MMAEWIDDAANAPAIFLIGDGMHGSGSGFDCAIEDCVGIIDHKNHANSSAAQRLRAEILVLWRFVCDPEVAISNRELRDYASVGPIKAKDFARAEGLFVKGNGGCASANGEHWRYGSLWHPDIVACSLQKRGAIVPEVGSEAEAPSRCIDTSK